MVLSLVKEEIQLQLQDELRERIAPALYEQWFSGSEVVSCTGDALELGVKNRFFKGWIETRYLDVLRDAARKVVGAAVAVRVCVAPHLYGSFREEQARDQAEAEALAPSVPALLPPPPVRRTAGAGMALNADFTFDAFVVGAANRLSHAVALRAVECPGDYDRVFFCGDHGVGKTHLLQAIAHELRLRRPDAAIVYVTGERFVADFVAAHAAGSVKQFRAAYRSGDVLLLDQLQVLGEGNKAATQAELLALVDEFEAAGKQVFFAAIASPGELSGLDVRLRDRLGAGFVDRLSLPDDGMRRELLRRKLEEKGVNVGNDVLDLLASEISGNVRRLEGVVSRLSALVDIGGMEPTLACVRMALEVAPLPVGRTSLTWGDVASVVAEEYGVSVDALLGRGRAGVLRRARGVAALLCRRLLGLRWGELGGVFGGRSHATLISMVRGVPHELFGDGVESRGVERILFRLGVDMKPADLLEKQGSLFE